MINLDKNIFRILCDTPGLGFLNLSFSLSLSLRPVNFLQLLVDSTVCHVEEMVTQLPFFSPS